MTKRTRLFLGVASGILVVGLGTGLVAAYVGGFQNLPLIGGDGPAELTYVPADAGVVAYADIRNVMNSEVRRKLSASLQGTGDGAAHFKEQTGIDLGVLGLGLAAYGALFALVGAAIRRPLVVGLVFVFGWELVTLVMPGYLKRFTLAYYLQTLVPHAMPTGDTVSLLQGAVFREPPSVAVSIGVLVLAIVASLALAARVVEQREYVLEQ